MRYVFLLVIPGLLLAIWAQWRMLSVYRRWSQQACATRRLTGAVAAREILDAAGLSTVAIESTSGYLTDHYDPRARALRLSAEVHDTDSLAAIGIAAHEAGHALQHQDLYWPIQVRLAVLPFTRAAAWLALPMLAAGLALRVPPFLILGTALFMVLMVFQLISLPLEFDASRRAGRILIERRLVSSTELDGVGQVLQAAAWTYVASFTLCFVQMLRWLRFLRLPI